MAAINEARVGELNKLLVGLISARKSQRDTQFARQLGKDTDHQRDIHRIAKDIPHHDVWNESNIVPTGARSTRPELCPLREVDVGRHVRWIAFSGWRPDTGTEMNGVDLEPLVADDPPKRRVHRAKAVQQVS